MVVGDSHIWNEYELLDFLVQHQGENIIISTNGEGCCAQSIGLYKLLDLFKFKSVTIYTLNNIEYHAAYSIRGLGGGAGFRFFETTNESAEYEKFHFWNTRYIFGVLYNRALWHRIGLASYCHQRHKSNTLLNFGSNPHDIDSRKLFEIQQLFNYAPNSAKHFMQCMHELPIKIAPNDDYVVVTRTDEHTRQSADYYTSFLIDIVAETFTSGRSFFPTEKTVRPMLLQKPFIIMGPKCFLIHLRQMGFRTFHDFWDEEYDGFTGVERYTRILILIDNIAMMTIPELTSMYAKMQEILEHNYNLLINKTYTTNIYYVD